VGVPQSEGNVTAQRCAKPFAPACERDRNPILDG
jgi:hypothetical protein